MLNWQTIDNQMPQAYKTVILQLKEIDEPTTGFFDKKENKWELLDKNLANFDKEDIPYTIVAWHQMPPQYKEDLDLNLPSAALAESLTKAQINKLLEYTDKEYSVAAIKEKFRHAFKNAKNHFSIRDSIVCPEIIEYLKTQRFHIIHDEEENVYHISW